MASSKALYIYALIVILGLMNHAYAFPLNFFGKRQGIPTPSVTVPPPPTPSTTPNATIYTVNGTSFPYPFEGPKPNSTVPTGTYITNCTVPNTWALTFDDGPALSTSALLDALDEIGVKVTFFINGLNFNCIYDTAIAGIVKRAYESGHQIASHTWSHQDLATLSEEEIIRQAYDLEDAFRDIIGVAPRYIRPPYGSYNETVLAILKRLDYVVVGWDIDTEDALNGDSFAESALITHVQNIYRAHTPGIPHLSLGHETVNSTSYVTGPWAARYVKDLGYNTVQTGACLGDDPRNWYKDIGVPRGYTPGRTCQQL